MWLVKHRERPEPTPTPAGKEDVKDAWDHTLDKGRFLHGGDFDTLDEDIKQAAVMPCALGTYIVARLLL